MRGIFKADASSITLCRQDKEMVRYASCWRPADTANILGIGMTTIYRMLKEFGFDGHTLLGKTG